MGEMLSIVKNIESIPHYEKNSTFRRKLKSIIVAVSYKQTLQVNL